MQFQPSLEKRCLGQITRTQIKPGIIDGRGYCRTCKYDSKNNPNCKAYAPIVIRVFEVVENMAAS